MTATSKGYPSGTQFSGHVCARKREQRVDWSQDPGTCVIFAHMARWHRREMCVRGAMIINSEVRDICQWLWRLYLVPRINTRMRENGYEDTPYPSPIAACPDLLRSVRCKMSSSLPCGRMTERLFARHGSRWQMRRTFSSGESSEFSPLRYSKLTVFLGYRKRIQALELGANPLKSAPQSCEGIQCILSALRHHSKEPPSAHVPFP